MPFLPSIKKAEVSGTFGTPKKAISAIFSGLKKRASSKKPHYKKAGAHDIPNYPIP